MSKINIEDLFIRFVRYGLEVKDIKSKVIEGGILEVEYKITVPTKSDLKDDDGIPICGDYLAREFKEALIENTSNRKVKVLVKEIDETWTKEKEEKATMKYMMIGIDMKRMRTNPDKELKDAIDNILNDSDIDTKLSIIVDFLNLISSNGIITTFANAKYKEIFYTDQESEKYDMYCKEAIYSKHDVIDLSDTSAPIEKMDEDFIVCRDKLIIVVDGLAAVYSIDEALRKITNVVSSI